MGSEGNTKTKAIRKRSVLANTSGADHTSLLLSYSFCSRLRAYGVTGQYAEQRLEVFDFLYFPGVLLALISCAY